METMLCSESSGGGYAGSTKNETFCVEKRNLESNVAIAGL